MKTKLLLIFLFLAAAIKSQPSEFTLINAGSSENIFSFTQDDNGIIWAGGWREIIKIQGDQTESFSIPTNFPVYSLDCDAQNNLWIATQDTGLIKFDGVNWIYFNMREIVTRTQQFNNANYVRVDDNNNVWVGCVGGLARYDGANWVVYDDLNSPLQFWPDIKSIKFDGQHNLWFSNYYGAGRFNEGNWFLWNTLPAPPFQYLSTVAIGKDGTIWFGDELGLFTVKLVNDTTWLLYDDIKISPSSTYQFDIDNKNIKWFARFFLSTNDPKITAFNDTTHIGLVIPFDEVQNSTVNSVYVDKLNNKWFGFNNGYIVKYTGDFPTGIEDEFEITPNQFSLSQNYPNPFNPTTTIKFTILDLRFTILKVYDVLGNEIATLINEEKPAGSYEVEFDAFSLSSGIYFYRLKSGSYIETKKMIVLK